VDNRWTTKDLQEGSVGCNNGVFGDPAKGTVKACLILNCSDISQKHRVTGTLYDVTTNKPLDQGLLSKNGDKIEFEEQFDRKKTRTAVISNGSWTIDLESGKYRIVVTSKKQLWVKRTSFIKVKGTWDHKVFVSPPLKGWRVVVTWGSSPKVLDAHLFSKKGREVDLKQKVNHEKSGVVTVDNEIINGYGIETLTLSKLRGIYKYTVHNYSKEAPISNSEVSVVLYRNDKQLSEVYVPKNTGKKNWWNVFQINCDERTWKLIDNFDKPEHYSDK
jgi:uncharacterized protein YfaP (DUF2135 family)